MNYYNNDGFKEMTNAELEATEGGNPWTILKWGTKVIKYAWDNKDYIAKELVDGWNDGSEIYK